MYEGNDPGLVIQPVLLFKALGARIVVLTNAAGGLDPSFGPGTLMVMRDHINLTGRSPLIGPNADELGARRCDPERDEPAEGMTDEVDRPLSELLDLARHPAGELAGRNGTRQVEQQHVP